MIVANCENSGYSQVVSLFFLELPTIHDAFPIFRYDDLRPQQHIAHCTFETAFIIAIIIF